MTRSPNYTNSPKTLKIIKGKGRAWAYRNKSSWDIYYQADSNCEVINFEIPVEVKR